MADERSMRFGYLISEVEMKAKAILAGETEDIPLALMNMYAAVYEAKDIAFEVSREALDKVVGERRDSSRVRRAIDELLRRYPNGDPDIEYDQRAPDWTPRNPSWEDSPWVYVEIIDWDEAEGVEHRFFILKTTGAIYETASRLGPVPDDPIWTPS